MIPIDPRIEKLLPLSFLKAELARYPSIKSVQVNEYMWSLKKCWAGYFPHDQSVRLDPSVPRSAIVESINRKHPELALTEEEVWHYVFFHEAHHSQCGPDEWEADHYAMQRIFELRKKKQDEHKDFVSAISQMVRRGIRESLGRSAAQVPKAP